MPIGSHGFYSKKTEKARFDQQPVEACAAVSACLQAYRATGKSRWRKEAWTAFNWFLGDNDLADCALRSLHGRLSRWLASRPREREPGRGIDPLLPDGASGNAQAGRITGHNRSEGLTTRSCPLRFPGCA